VRSPVVPLHLRYRRNFGGLSVFIKQLVQGYFQGTRNLLKGFQRWNRVTVLNARDVASQEPRSLFDISLRQIFCFSEHSNSVCQKHNLSPCRLLYLVDITSYTLASIHSELNRRSKSEEIYTGTPVDSPIAQVFTPPVTMQTAQEFNAELQRRHAMWQEVQGFAAETRYTANYAIKSYCKYLADKPATKANHFDIQDHLYKLAKSGIAPATLATRLSSLRGFYDFLNMGGMVKWVPPRLVSLTKKLSKPPRVLTEDQVFRLIAKASTDHERALVEVLYGTGCRTGELTSMKIQDVDFRALRIKVCGKRGVRFVLFSPRVAKVLRKYIGKRTDGYLFVSNFPVSRLLITRTATGGWRCRWNVYDKDGGFKCYGRGRIDRSEKLSYPQAFARFRKLSNSDRITRPLGLKPLRTSTIARQIRHLGQRARVNVTPYSLRHSYGTHLLDHGANLRAIQELMGHRSLDSTRIYTHVSKHMLMDTLTQCHPLSVDSEE